MLTIGNITNAVKDGNGNLMKSGRQNICRKCFVKMLQVIIKEVENG
jgi:hypothetical protein